MATWLARFWDWIDKRDIEKHAVSICILYGTKMLTEWAMAYASGHADKPGLEVAAIISAVTGPYMVLQGAVIKFYFESRGEQ